MGRPALGAELPDAQGDISRALHWVAPALRRQDTHLRPAIPVEKRVAITLWKLATPDSYRSMGNQFRVGRSTIGAAVQQVIHTINDVLLQRVIRPHDLDATITGFATLGFPNCGRAVDRTHILIQAPEH
ncbi:uncharacterized protein LOC142830950 isoform X2 [Pelodiscus sinensis]|uniref:uncharacterized protein LOC142830950 isoform X2 n=1 Tax=Pelodiscus sinensis TaxID=13735 RepID=UPI003F6B8658